MLIAHQMARPVKVEGNPDHPASLGAASAIMQATILTLYDPRRAQSIVGNGQIDTWESFITALYERRDRLLARGGEGLRLLTGNVTSPLARSANRGAAAAIPGDAVASMGAACIATTSSPRLSALSAGRSSASSTSARPT